MKDLSSQFYELYEELISDIQSKRPFTIVSEEELEDQDIVSDLPYAQTTDKNGYFRIPLAVTGVDENGYVTCIGTGEEDGEWFLIMTCETPVESLLEIHNFLRENK